jgi:hypothetical protein
MVADRVAVYGGAMAGIQYASPSSGANQTELMLGGDVGAEFFLADSWALRVGPTYRYIRESETVNNRSVSGSANAFGVNWAIAGYF